MWGARGAWLVWRAVVWVKGGAVVDGSMNVQ